MRQKLIPKTEILVSQIALGTWPLSGEFWSHVEEKTCLDIIQTALDSGINFFDTAPFYGMGRAEDMLGKAAQGRRDKFVIATKCGLEKTGRAVRINLTPAFIRQELEDSLKRLQTDYVDLYQTHWPDEKTPVEETYTQMRKFVDEGKARAIGICNADRPLLEKTAPYNLSTVQNEFSLLKRESEKDVLPYCETEGIGFLAYGPLAGGILSGKYRDEPKFSKGDPRQFFYKYYQGEAFKAAKKVVDQVNVLAEVHKTKGAAVALGWVTSRPGILSALVGAKTPEQVKNNALGGRIDISYEGL